LLRTRLANYVFGQSSLPYKDRPIDASDQTVDGWLANVRGARTLLRVKQDFGLDSIVVWIKPSVSDGRLLIVHEGHAGETAREAGFVDSALRAGFEVIVMGMPAVGRNPKPIVDLPGRGLVKVVDHEILAQLEPERGRPIQFFIRPVVAVINQIMERADVKMVAMAGLSGGGWTTLLTAALDPRIARSAEVSGSAPFFLSAGEPSLRGDYEQTDPGMYRIANYLELYALASLGAGRKHVQVVLPHDPCCFGGAGYELYADAVGASVARLGAGDFGVMVDKYAFEHDYSDELTARILPHLDGYGEMGRLSSEESLQRDD
jgi:pimeloyl-ACP methyl ester carboxylesterase